MRTLTGTSVVLTPENSDLVVATPRLLTPKRAIDPQLSREFRQMLFEVRGDWLDGVVNSRDRVAVSVDIAGERWSGRIRQVVAPTVSWWRQHIDDLAPLTVRWWAEESMVVADKATAHQASDALFGALTANPNWLRAINDGDAKNLGDALAIATRGGLR